MDSMTLIAIVSILAAGLTISIGVIAPALGEGKAVATALIRWRAPERPRPSPAHYLSEWRSSSRWQLLFLISYSYFANPFGITLLPAAGK